MTLQLCDEIRRQAVRYVQGLCTLDEFDTWFGPASWNIHQLGDPDAVRLVGAIDLLLSEYTNGDWVEASFMTELHRIVTLDAQAEDLITAPTAPHR